MDPYSTDTLTSGSKMLAAHWLDLRLVRWHSSKNAYEKKEKRGGGGVGNSEIIICAVC